MKERFACVHIFLGTDFVPAGLIEVVEDGPLSTCRYRYFDEYLERKDAVAVDPVRLPLHDAMRGNRVFDGPLGGDLFGGIEDACPDSWGRHVLDTAAENAGHALQPYDYMLYAGRERIGALGFSERIKEPPFQNFPDWLREPLDNELSLEEMLRAADKVEDAENLEPQYRRFFVRGSSLGGAKPKAAIEHEGESWIAKFGAEREVLPTCRMEHATMELARLCGIRTPETRIVTVYENRDILLVKRFDRLAGTCVRLPFVSALTMLGRSRSEADHPATYINIAEAMRRYCAGSTLKNDLAELFSRMIFNICCNNNDDHLRNHGFLHLETRVRGWTLSPLYDVVPQPFNQETLQLGIGSQGRKATFENALSSAAHFGLSREEAENSVLKIKKTVFANWEKLMRGAGVPASLLPMVRKSFKAVF